MSQLFALVDLASRWSYTKAGVHLLAKREDFPLPIAMVCNERIKLYGLDDIRAYEQSRPWLFDTNLKEQYMKGKLKALQKKADEGLV